jgi:hypothetical protein
VPNVELTRPTSHITAILTGATATKIGTSATADFLIKVQKARFRFVVPDRETSGDGDAAPAHQLSYWRYDSFVFMGFVPAQSVAVFPLASFITTTKNPITASNFKFTFGTSQVLTFPTVIINTCELAWVRNDGALDVVMSGKATDSHGTWSTT